MRKIIIVAMLIMASVASKAQDIIITKSGDNISSIIIGVNQADVVYKTKIKHRHSSKQNFTIPKSDVRMIRYHNGRTEMFDNEPERVSQRSADPVASPDPEPEETKPIRQSKTKNANVVTQQTPVSKPDKIYLHSGTVIDGNVIIVSEYTVTYKYQGETSEQVISKYAVDKIIHGNSNRVEKITDKARVYSASDWENVVLLEDKSQITGLTKVDEIRGKATNWTGFSDLNRRDAKSTKKMKEAAADMGCPFVLLTNSLNGQGQSIRKGIGYKY